MSIQHVRKSCREFKDGRTDVHDEQRSGRPSVSDETIAEVEETMLKDRRVKVWELCEMIPDVSKTCIPTFAARRESSTIQA
jgi:transposase